MLDVAKLATLREVVRHGSFSAAATALALTQPAVSRQVSLLERRLGTQLVRRTRQGVLPTEAGERLVAHTDVVLGHLAAAEADIASLVGLRSGRVRVGMFFTAFAVLAPRVEAAAQERLPDLRITYELVDRATAFGRLRTAELDLAVVFEHPFEPQPPPPGIRIELLGEDPARVLLPARHRLAKHDVLTLDQLAGETWVRPREGSAARLLDHLVPGAPTLAAGQGDEPVEAQVHVAAGTAVALAHELNVLINPAEIAVRPLLGAPPRRIEAAIAGELRAPAPQAVLALLRGGALA